MSWLDSLFFCFFLCFLVIFFSCHFLIFLLLAVWDWSLLPPTFNFFSSAKVTWKGKEGTEGTTKRCRGGEKKNRTRRWAELYGKEERLEGWMRGWTVTNECRLRWCLLSASFRVDRGVGGGGRRTSNASGVTVSATGNVRVAFRVAIDIIGTAAATSAASGAASATTTGTTTGAAVVVDVDAGNVGIGAGIGSGVGRRQWRAGTRMMGRRCVLPRRHALVDGVQTFGLVERSDLVGRRETLQGCKDTNWQNALKHPHRTASTKTKKKNTYHSAARICHQKGHPEVKIRSESIPSAGERFRFPPCVKQFFSVTSHRFRIAKKL